MIEALRRTLARWLDPDTYTRYERVVSNLDELAARCEYGWPTVRVVRDYALRAAWLDHDDDPPPTVETVKAWLEQENGGHEPLELTRRLEQMLLELYGDLG
jgi:hypothetical protein